MNTNIYIALAASIAVLTGLGAGIGIGIATSKAAEAVGRQPEAANKIMNLSIIGMAFSEATAIYGFLVAIILLILKWGT